MRYLMLLSVVLLSGCCQWGHLKKDAKREYQRDVKSMNSLPGDAMGLVRQELEQTPHLVKDAKREFRRDMNAPTGMWQDIKELDCSE